MRDDSRKNKVFDASHVVQCHLRAVDCSRSKLYSLAVAARRKLGVGVCVGCLSRGSCHLWFQVEQRLMAVFCLPTCPFALALCSSSREAVKLSDMAEGMLQSDCRLGKYGV